MRIDILREAVRNIIVATHEDKSEAFVDISDMFVEEREAKEIIQFLAALGVHAYLSSRYRNEKKESRKTIELCWDTIVGLYCDEDYIFFH